MRSLLAWIWDEVASTISSISSSYLMPIMTAIAGIGILSSIYFYQSLCTAQLEKEHAIEQVLTLERTVLRLQKTRNTDNKIANIIIKKNDIWDNKNTQVALEIAEIPRLEWEQNGKHVQEHLGEHFGQQKSNNNEKNICSIDTPLPRLSVPLIMLYNEVSRPYNATASTMAHEYNSFASTSSTNNDSPSACPVDKGASHDIR